MATQPVAASNIDLTKYDPSDTTSPIYRYVSSPSAVHKSLLQGGPLKMTLGEEREHGTPVELRFINHIRAYHRPMYGASTPDTPRFAENYIKITARFGKLLFALRLLLGCARFTLVEDAYRYWHVCFARARDRFLDKTAEYSKRAHTIRRRHDPFDNRDAEDDYDYASYRLVENNVIGPDVYRVELDDDRALNDFYNEAEVYGSYPLQGVLAMLFAACRTILKCPKPAFQQTMIWSLPYELLSMVASYLSRRDQIRLACTCRVMSRVCERLYQRTATLVSRVNEEFITDARAGSHPMSSTDAILSELLVARDGLLKSLNQLLQSASRKQNVRDLSVVNQWIDMTPGYIDHLPDPHNPVVYGDIYDALCVLLASTSLASLRVRGFGITYPMLNLIHSTPSLHALHLDRCHAVVARLEPLRIAHTVTSTTVPITIHHPILHASLDHVTRLTLGFGIEPYTRGRVWNIVTLCPRLESLYCYASDVCSFYFPPEDLYPRLRLGAIKDLTLENCLPELSVLVESCKAGVADDDNWGGWERLKIKTILPFDNDEAQILISYIKVFQPQLKVFILEGARKIHSQTIRSIALACTDLERLAIARRIRDDSQLNTCCLWDEPLLSYAKAIGEFVKLKDFTANFVWSLNDRVIPPSPGASFADLDGPYTLTDEPSQENPRRHPMDAPLLARVPYEKILQVAPQWKESPTYHVVDEPAMEDNWDPANLAWLFASQSQSLESLACRGRHETEFKVLIRRPKYGDGVATLWQLDAPEDDVEDRSWNPMFGHTWES